VPRNPQQSSENESRGAYGQKEERPLGLNIRLVLTGKPEQGINHQVYIPATTLDLGVAYFITANACDRSGFFTWKLKGGMRKKGGDSNRRRGGGKEAND